MKFSNPDELLKFVDKLRKLSGGKPVGIACLVIWELISIIKAMTTTKKYVDFITVDGAEGGTVLQLNLQIILDALLKMQLISLIMHWSELI